MKKAVLLFTGLCITGASFAYVQEYTTSDIKRLQGTGYSQEALKIVDTARMLTQGEEKDYVPFYSTKLYSTNKGVKWYQVVKRYFDPIQEEHTFGVREINYDNSWFDLSPSYYQKHTPNNRYQRLTDEDKDRLDTAGKIIKGSNGIEQDNTDKKYEIENL